MTSGPIVHIGYHKTATTWFQQVFYAAVRNRRYIERSLVYRAFIEPPGFTFDPAAVRALTGLSAKSILCEEELSGYLHNGGLGGFGSRIIADRLHRTCPDARIVIFVRAQPAMAAASYLQYVRVGGTYRPGRYLFPARYLHGAAGDPYKAPRFSIDHLAYHRLAEHYARLFGDDRVSIFAYEDMAADPEAFAHRYAAALGLDVDWGAVSFAPRNVSYGRLALAAARLLNHFSDRAVIDKNCLLHIPGLYSARRHVLELINRIPGPAMTPEQVLGPKLCAEIAERFAPSNSALAARFDVDLESFGYAMPTATPARIVEAVPSPALMRLASVG